MDDYILSDWKERNFIQLLNNQNNILVLLK